MYKNLTIDHTISLVTKEEVEEFKSLATKYSFLTKLIGNREFDLFLWRLTLDVFHLINQKHTQVLFLPDRAMVSPLQYYLLNKFVASNEFKRLAYTKGHSKYERFILSVKIAMSIKRWAFTVLQDEKNSLQEVFHYGDLFGFIHSAKMDIENLPLDLLKKQADVMKKLKQSITEEDLFHENIKNAIKMSKELGKYLDLPIEECLQWKITQSK